MSKFSALKTVFNKEVVENSRDRRAMGSALLYGPLFGPIFFAVILTFVLGLQQEQSEKPLELPVVGEEFAPNLVRYLRIKGVEIQAPPSDAEESIRSQQHDVVLRIPKDFGERWNNAEPARVEILQDRSRQNARTTVQRVHGLIESYSQQTGALRLQVRGIDPNLSRAVVGIPVDLSTPQARAGLLMAMLPYFLILSAFVGGMYLAIDTTSGEKERQSLEPLLITPASRAQILWGKMLATAFFAGLSLLICVIAFVISMRFVPTEEFGLDLSLSVMTGVKMLLIVLPIALLAATAQTIVASFSKSFREAQTYLQFLILVPAIPSILLAINPIKPALWMKLTPLFSQSVLITNITRGDEVPLTLFVGSMLITLVAAVIMGLIAVKLYSREQTAL